MKVKELISFNEMDKSPLVCETEIIVLYRIEGKNGGWINIIGKNKLEYFSISFVKNSGEKNYSLVNFRYPNFYKFPDKSMIRHYVESKVSPYKVYNLEELNKIIVMLEL